MAGEKFDAKSFNPQAFRYLAERVPNLQTAELKKSRALVGNTEIAATMKGQYGTGYIRLAQKGLLDGTAVNYDGQTDITATSTKTYERGIVVVGRAKAWTEKDFSYDITGGVDFMANVAAQVAEYWDNVDQTTILAILDGIFAMNDTTKNKEFVAKHTTDISGGTTENTIDGTTVNTATNKACGKNKKKFTLVFLHPDVATNLENLRLLKYLTYTDKEGVTRDLSVGTWNGKTVVVDDTLPVEEVENSGNPYNKYTSYILGDGAFEYENVGAKVPEEMDRKAAEKGGVDILYSRQRKIFAPKGISYEKKNQASNSPTDAELKDGTNWTLIHSGETVAANRSYIDHHAIPIARIISRG